LKNKSIISTDKKYFYAPAEDTAQTGNWW